MNTRHLHLIQDDLSQVEILLRKQAVGQHKDLQQALDIIISSGGKRIRPIITLLIGKMLASPREPLITLAASIEMLHTATLVHDDLIDGSLLRRGLPTLNAHWAPGATVLTGDFMFARAAELAANTESLDAMKLFAQTLGVIVNGEIAQLFSSKCSYNREQYFNRIYAKTASLFRTCCCSAALISPVDEQTVNSLCSFGYEIGMAFQIMDDILDFTGEQQTIGKPVANDLRIGLITLPAIIYFENNPDENAVKMMLNGDCETNDFQDNIDEIIDAIKNSNAIQLALDEAQQYVDRAVVELDKQPNCEEREALFDIANFIIHRDI